MYDLLEPKHFQIELWPFNNSYGTNFHFLCLQWEKKNTAADDSQGDKLDGKGCICFFLSLNWGWNVKNIYYVDRRAVLVNLNCRHFCIHIHKMSDTEYILYNLWIHNADLCAISGFVKYIRFSQKPSQQYSFFCLRLRLSMKMILHLHGRNLTYIIGDFYDISWMFRWEIASIS